MIMRGGGPGGHDVEVILTDMRSCMFNGNLCQYSTGILSLMRLAREAGLTLATALDLHVSRTSFETRTFNVNVSHGVVLVWTGSVRASEARRARVAPDDPDAVYDLHARAAFAAGTRVLRSPAARAVLRLLEVKS